VKLESVLTSAVEASYVGTLRE